MAWNSLVPPGTQIQGMAGGSISKPVLCLDPALLTPPHPEYDSPQHILLWVWPLP